MFRILSALLLCAGSLVFVALGWSASAAAQTCTQIQTIQDLQNIQNNLSGSYCLANDIDASATANTPFVPIGTNTAPFSGVFDGQGFSVNLLNTTTTPVYIGLFGYVGVNGQVRNINVTNANIATSATTTLPTNIFVGAVAGWNDGTISQSSSSGSVGTFGHVLGTVGGLVGGNTGTINYSQSSASVANDIKPGGGLVGYNVGTIHQSLATGSVQGGGFPATSGGFVGGFVGLNDTGGVISESYALGSVTEDDGSVGYGAGLIGLNHGSVTQTYSIGGVSSVNNPGGLMGGNDGTVSSSYWDTQTSEPTDERWRHGPEYRTTYLGAAERV